MPDQTAELASGPQHPQGHRKRIDPLRYYRSHMHLASPFGSDWFGTKAEAFARFFGTPLFWGVQSVLVVIWITLNSHGIVSFDVYPFILLNLAFSVQAAYAAPLILLAQTRQAERDKVHAEAEAQHRDNVAATTAQHQEQVQQMSEQILILLKQNTELTELTKQLSERVETLTYEVYTHMLQEKAALPPKA